MAMVRKGLNMITSNFAKVKTGIQIGLIIFILLFLGLKGLPIIWINWLLNALSWKDIIYYLMLGMTLFTAITGITYIYENRLTIKQFLT